MVIHKTLSEEYKGNQQTRMVYDCINYWCWLNNHDYQSYPDIMNMKTCRWDDEHHYSVALTNIFKLNKW